MISSSSTYSDTIEEAFPLEKRIQNPAKHLRWKFSQKRVFSLWLLLQKASSYIFDSIPEYTSALDLLSIK